MSKPYLYLGNLQGSEGNAFAVLGAAARVAKDEGLDWEPIRKDAMSGGYDHLLQVIKDHFEVEVLAESENGRPQVQPL